MVIIEFVLLILAVSFSIIAVTSRDILNAVIFLSICSLSIVTIFLLLNAPDIAITKAAVESGLVTAFYLVAIHKTGRKE
ncbi:MAG: sodium:proton antiporter [Candidatus Aenigmatarchaeota archaeon]|nr:MAG: sodium:proton antiporter [Candidatus Aenigmarchaeota archaeon]